MPSERYTCIELPGVSGSAIAEYGEKDAGHMITFLRRHAEYQAKVWQAVLAADDKDFQIESYTGYHVRKKRKTIQDSR